MPIFYKKVNVLFVPYNYFIKVYKEKLRLTKDVNAHFMLQLLYS
jgi:hypothetical protein